MLLLFIIIIGWNQVELLALSLPVFAYVAFVTHTHTDTPTHRHTDTPTHTEFVIHFCVLNIGWQWGRPSCTFFYKNRPKLHGTKSQSTWYSHAKKTRRKWRLWLCWLLVGSLCQVVSLIWREKQVTQGFFAPNSSTSSLIHSNGIVGNGWPVPEFA